MGNENNVKCPHQDEYIVLLVSQFDNTAIFRK